MREINWKAVTTAVYLAICVFDFLVVPTLLAALRSEAAETIIMLQNQKVDPAVVSQVAQMGHAQDWIPFTLRGGGLFHLSFGAILTGSVLKGKKNGD